MVVSAACSSRFLLPFIDIGISQSPMLHPTPSTLAQRLPGYGGSRVLLDGALTNQFDETRALAYGLIWLTVLAILVTITYHRSINQQVRATHGVQPG